MTNYRITRVFNRRTVAIIPQRGLQETVSGGTEGYEVEQIQRERDDAHTGERNSYYRNRGSHPGEQGSNSGHQSNHADHRSHHSRGDGQQSKGHRSHFSPSTISVALSADETDLLPQMVNAGYRRLAIELHPDHEGDHDKMVALNNLKEKLLNSCK